MPQKKGAGNRPQDYDADTGRFGERSQKTVDSIRRYSDDPERDIAEAGLTDEWANMLSPGGHLDTEIPEEELYDYVSKDLHVSLDQAVEYVDSVLEYTDSNFEAIRAYQCGEKVKDELKIKKIADNLEQYIKKARRWNGGETVRGISLNDNELAKYVPGYKFIGMKGTASWSSDPRVANNFAERGVNMHGGNAVIFHSPTQKKGTSVTHLSMLGGTEREVLVSKDARYRVVGRKDDGRRIHIYLKEI